MWFLSYNLIHELLWTINLHMGQEIYYVYCILRSQGELLQVTDSVSRQVTQLRANEFEHMLTGMRSSALLINQMLFIPGIMLNDNHLDSSTITTVLGFTSISDLTCIQLELEKQITFLLIVSLTNWPPVNSNWNFSSSPTEVIDGGTIIAHWIFSGFKPKHITQCLLLKVCQPESDAFVFGAANSNLRAGTLMDVRLHLKPSSFIKHFVSAATDRYTVTEL